MNEFESKIAKRTLLGAILVFMVDMYDVYAPLIFLAPAMEYFLPKTISTNKLTIFYGFMFAVALIGRPIGAWIFGYFTDKIGRKKVTVIVVTGFSTMMLLIAMLPGYSVLGDLSVYFFILFRLITGLFLGGGYTSAIPLAIENAPKEKRGLYAGFINTGYPIAFTIVSLITLVLLSVFSKETYMIYGWRIPFIVGVILGLFVVFYTKKLVPESILWEKAQAKGEKTIFKDLFKGKNFAHLLQVFILSIGMVIGIVGVASTMSIIYIKTLKLSSSLSTEVILFSYTVLIITAILGGWWSDKIGRRKAFLIYGLLLMIVSPTLYYLIITGLYKNTILLFLFSAIIVTLSSLPVTVLLVYINERFKTSIRASGYAIGYSTSFLIAGFFVYYQKLLSNFVPFKFTQLILISLAGLLWIIGALLGPETKDLDLEKID
ncbi:MAG: MFS transporter [Candidatus Micrarchaeaceae archaeon]